MSATEGLRDARPGTTGDGMDVAAGGWFTERSAMWPGQGLSFEVKETLFRGRSEYQDIAVFRTNAFGTVLVLDGAIQVRWVAVANIAHCTDRDEFAYQEMLAHLPLQSLAEPPKRVLVVGGGDGGVLRELVRYPSIQQIDIAELDSKVIEIAKQYFPAMAVGFSDPRVRVSIGDGTAFVRAAAEGSYDAIIVDSSDPVGPAEVLYQQPFYESMHRALREGGVVATQAESIWLHMPIIERLAAMCARVFRGGSVSYGYTTIPTYPSGQIGFMMCSKGRPVNFPQPKQPEPQERPGIQPLRYYSHEVHRAAFVLPRFAQAVLGPHLTAA